MKLSETLKRDLKLSLKTIRYEFPRYLCFFVILFLLQGLFCSILTLYSNNDRTQMTYLESEYRTQSGSIYHLKLLGCSDTQRALLHNFDMDQDEDDKLFTLLGADVTQTEGGARRSDLYIQFEEDVEESYRRFVQRYSAALAETGQYVEAPTLLLSYRLERAGNRAVLILQLISVVVLGALAVWVFHTIMTNHYKFTYGVYLSFGADFLRLFRTAIWEMVWAALFTWLPAVLLSNLICWLLFSRSGLDFHPNLPACFGTLLISLLTVGIAVFASMKAVSRKPPVTHLVADDNSNLIRSPRRSKPLLGSTFPQDIGRLSFARFVKYTVRLLATTLSFAMLYVGMITLGNCYQRMLDVPRPLYRVDFAVPGNPGIYSPSQDKEEEEQDPALTDTADSTTTTVPAEEAPVPETAEDMEPDEEEAPIDYSAYGYTDELSALYQSLPHVGAILKDSTFPARGLRSHVRFDKSIANFGAGGVNVSKSDGDWRYQINVDYRSLDSEIIDAFRFLGYGIEGSLESVLNNSRTIAVTDGFMGAKRFDWEIGDVVYIARPVEPFEGLLLVEKEMILVTDPDQILMGYLNKGNFEYIAYTVGAIISNMPTDSNWALFLNADDYQTVTGYPPIYDRVEVFAKKGSTEEEEAELYEALRKSEFVYSDLRVTDLHTRLSLQIDRNKNYTGVYTLFAVILLLVSAMAWIVSQILFYQKRRGEFELYLAIGATQKGIYKFHLQDALLYMVASAGLFAILSPIASWIIHRVIGYLTILFGGEMLAAFELPLPAYLIGIFVSALCGFAGTMISYKLYARQSSPLRNSRAQTMISEDTSHE